MRILFGTAMVFAENTHEVTVLNAQQQTRKAVGVVTDKTGEAIIGANVIVKGTTNGTITDMDGRFELDVPNNATLQVSYIGFNTQEIVFTDNLLSRFNWSMIRKPWMKSW